MSILERFGNLEYGALASTNNFVLLTNPGLFSMFKLKHWILFIIGAIGSILPYRIMMPFMLIILLTLNYSKFDRKVWILSCIFLIANVLHHIFTSKIGW